MAGLTRRVIVQVLSNPRDQRAHRPLQALLRTGPRAVLALARRHLARIPTGQAQGARAALDGRVEGANVKGNVDARLARQVEVPVGGAHEEGGADEVA